MTGVGDDLRLHLARDVSRESFHVCGWNDAIVRAPKQQGGNPQPVQPFLQAPIAERPDNSRRCLVGAEKRDFPLDLVVVIASVKQLFVLGGVVRLQRDRIVRHQREDVAAGILHIENTIRVAQDQPAHEPRDKSSDFRAEHAGNRAAYDVRARQSRGLQQIERGGYPIKMTVEVSILSSGSLEARQRRYDDLSLHCEKLQEWRPARASAQAEKDAERLAVTLLPYAARTTRHLYGRFGDMAHRRSAPRGAAITGFGQLGCSHSFSKMS